MDLTGKNMPRIGMGCWPIGGVMTADGASVGYTNVTDAESLRTLEAAYHAGIRLFDTAAAYGAGHSEKLLAQAFKKKSDVFLVSKAGIGINESTKELTGPQIDPQQILDGIEGSLRRLQREHIDLLLLHLNDLPIIEAEPIFDVMEDAVRAGKLRGYGWSTDFTPSLQAFADRTSFVAVEHACNVMMDTPRITSAVEKAGITALIRSPLAMGVLTGKFTVDTQMSTDDVRGNGQQWNGYFTKDGRPNPKMLDILGAIRELLQTGERSLTQGVLCWLLGRSDQNIPVPGARTAEQIIESAGALEFGPLPSNVMDEIETLIPRNPDAPEMQR